MNVTLNGKTKWYVAVIYMLVATLYIVVRETTPRMTTGAQDQRQEVINANKIAVLDTEIKNVKDIFGQFREENREDHQEINRKLDALAKK